MILISEVLLNVLPVLIEDLLRLAVPPKCDTLRECLESILHLLEFLRGDVWIHDLPRGLLLMLGWQLGSRKSSARCRPEEGLGSRSKEEGVGATCCGCRSE